MRAALWVIALACCYRPVDLTGGDGGHGGGGGDVGTVPDAPKIGLDFTVGDGANKDGPVANLPVLIALAPGLIDLAPVVHPAQDLAFFDHAANALVPYDIEVFDPTGTTLVWIRVPMIPNAGTVSYTLTVEANASSSLPSAWADQSFVAHFEPTTTGAIDSSPVDHLGGMPSGTLGFAKGLVGSGLGYAGGAGQLEFANMSDVFAGWTSAAIDFWYRSDFTVDSPAMVTTELSHVDGSFDAVTVLPTNGGSDVDATLVVGMFATDTEINLTPSQWTHIAVVDTNGQINVWANGNIQAAGAGGVGSGGPVLQFGDTTTPVGTLDELRIGSNSVTRQYLEAEDREFAPGFVTFTP